MSRATVAAACGLLLAAPLAATSLPAGAASAAVDTAHLRLEVTTTSDWTQVHLSPGAVEAEHLVSKSGTGNFQPQSDGVGLTGVTGAASVTVDLVLYAPSPPASYTVRLTKGFLGSTATSITNLNSGPSSVGTYVDRAHSLNDGNNSVSARVPARSLMTTTPMPMPSADHRRLVLAFYYPWFASYRDPHLADRPVDPHNVWDQTAVDAMTRQAKNHGVNGFVISYAGDSHDGAAFDVALRAAEHTGQYVTGYAETERATTVTSLGAADPTVMLNWLERLLARRSSPAFLKASNGNPIVFVYGMERLLPRHWRAIENRIRRDLGVQVDIVGDSLNPDYLPYEWGVHRYAVNDKASVLRSWSRTASLSARAPAVVDPKATPKLFAGTVSPGFNDTRLRGNADPVISRAGGARYDDTWQAALAGRPDWVLVSTWNEWYEDSQIEPGVATGGHALTQTAQHAASFRSSR